MHFDASINFSGTSIEMPRIRGVWLIADILMSTEFLSCCMCDMDITEVIVPSVQVWKADFFLKKKNKLNSEVLYSNYAPLIVT